jgi:outer membrane autotransporter protein
MAAYWGSTIDADSSQVTTAGADAYGAHARDGGKVTLTNASITTSGARSTGVVAEAVDATRQAGSLVIGNSSIKTTGESAHGVALYGGGSSLNMTGGSIAATGKDSAGIFASNNSTATLTGVKVTSAGPSIISRFRSGAAQNITLGADTYLTENNGTLLLVKRESGGETGTVNLNLNAGSFAAGNILDKDATGKVNVKRNGGHWAGIVIDGATKEVAPDSAPQADFNTPGSVSIAASTSGSGPTTFTGETSIGGSVSLAPSASTVFQGSTTIADHMVGQQGASTQFNGVTNIGQSVTGAQNSTFTFSGASTTIGGSIAGTTGSTMTFAGGATIGGNVEAAGDGGSFVFSQTAPTTIGGNVQLGQGASLKGGTVGTPITIAGAAVVNSGAVLGGNLVVTGPLSGTGGTLSPGNSVGTQRYGTSGEFSGAYVAEVNAAGKSDLIIIDNGNLNLAGVDLSVSQENGNGGYVLNHDYTIVQTVNGNVEGTFKSAALDSTFAGTLVNLDPVKYSQKDAKVSLSVDTSKVSAKRSGLSANQNATLDGVISVAGRNASADAALLSTDTGAAMNQLSGELHASTQSALLNSSSLLTNTIAKRMRGNVGAGMVAGAPVAQSSGSMPAGAMPSSAAYPLWAEVVGNWSSLDGNNNAAKVKSDTAGLFIGGDVGVGKGWRLGATLGFTDGKIKVNDRSSRSDVRSYTAAIYGGNSWATAKGSVNFLAGAGYTRHDIDSRRTVTVGGNQTLKADYKANTTHLFTELGYAMPVGKASVVEPYLGLAWISQRAKGFNESGGSAALSGQSQTDNVTTFTLGARGKTTIEAGRHEVRLSAGAGWRHAAGDVDASRKMSFIQGNGATFQVAGAPIAKNAAVVDLGAEMTVGKNAAMGLAYSGQFGNGNTDSTGSLYLKYRFK